jgi:hypothetical protein
LTKKPPAWAGGFFAHTAGFSLPADLEAGSATRAAANGAASTVTVGDHLGVYYTARDSFGYTAIRFFDYARQRSVVVASRQITGPVNSLAVSPDGRNLLFTRTGGDAEFDLILVSF